MQQRQFEEIRAHAPWFKSRRGMTLYGLFMGVATFGAGAVGMIAAGAPWLVVGGLAIAGIAVVTYYMATRQPDEFLAKSVRRNFPDAETLRRGAAAFQVNGGRVPKADEKPPPPYWRTK